MGAIGPIMPDDHPLTGIYSATYSNIPVYEFQFGPDLKEHVMRRRQDDWINATHILKAAGFDKPARTRILEREVQKDVHEKVQGGYGKYQGTWIPLEQGQLLAQRNNVYERLRPIFEFEPGPESPPPAPRHTSKPKAPKSRPAVPKWNSKSHSNRSTSLLHQATFSHRHAQQGASAHASSHAHDDYDNAESALNDDDTPDNLTVASASYMAEDDRYDAAPHYASTGHRKRKREEMLQDLTEQQHAMYGDELLDYFLLSRNEQNVMRPEPPPNFQPDWPIDTDRHTALHWASAMGDVEVIKQLKRFNASLDARNVRGETPFMRAVHFTNCYEKQTFPLVMKELFSTVDARDNSGCTVIHHAAVMKSGRAMSQSCSRYYLDNILNKLQELRTPDEVQALLDAQDNDGNTALHLAAMQDARKCIRALLGRGAATDIPNNQGVRAEDLIRELNAAKSKQQSQSRAAAQRSSSPFGPDSAGQRRGSFSAEAGKLTPPPKFRSEAANAVTQRIEPLIIQRIRDLAQSYDAELNEKEEAEREAKRILNNAQAELQALKASIAELEARLEPEESAAKVEHEADELARRVLAYVTHQNRIMLREWVRREVGVNGETKENENPDGEKKSSDSDPSKQTEHMEDDDPQTRLSLAQDLYILLTTQRRHEQSYVSALGALGTGSQIDKYRHLLRACLPPEDQELLDENLEELIKMMEEEASSEGVTQGGGVIGPAASVVAQVGV